MDKKKAQERLTAIETEVAQLRKIIDAPINIMERVKTFADACEVLGITTCGEAYRKLGINFNSQLNTLSIHSTLDYALKIKIIVLALNEGWKPDMGDRNQYKYLPYFEKNSFGFVYFTYFTWNYYIYSPTSLLFETSEKAQYAGVQFQTEYNDYLNN